ncbi:S41 family peptidase [bacterium]|nr:S41 family peptidase [bacterium]
MQVGVIRARLGNISTENNKKAMKIYLWITLVVFFLGQKKCHSQSNRIDNWKVDIEFLKKELPKKHIDLFYKLDKKTFENELNEIINNIPNLTDVQITIKLQQLIVKVGDTHTNVRWQPFIRTYRDKGLVKVGFQSYYFQDGLYIIEARNRNSQAVGKKIKGVNGVSLTVVMDSLKTMFVNENEALSKLEIASLIPNHQLLNHFGFTPFIDKRYFTIELVDTLGKEIHHRLNLNGDKLFSPYSSSLKLIYGETKGSFYDRWFVDYHDTINHVYLIQYNKCYSKELAIRDNIFLDKVDLLPSFEDFEEIVIQTIENDSISKFIFDLRYNGGGSSSQGTQLINRLSEIEKLNNNQKIFVLIGRETFSSATLNAIDFKKKTDAVFVGEDTKGKPSHFGEVRELILPNTKLRVGYSTKYFYHGKDKSKTYFSKRGIRKINDDRSTIQPDYYIELTFKDFVNQIDPVYKWVMGK